MFERKWGVVLHRHLWLFLSFLFHDSPARMRKLAGLFSDWESCRVGLEDFFVREGISEKSLGYYRERIQNFDPEKVLAALASRDIGVLYADDELFPSQVLEIHQAPLLLYYRGDVSLLSRAMLGVVGTRKMSDYGRRATEKLVAELAPYFLIVSGMAEGIDTVAHRTTLEAGHPTVSVVGTGLDVVYPTSNTGLFGEIISNGVVLSEFPLGVSGLAYRFPQRNRIVSGLCQGLLVVEAGEKSGSLITARLAMEENRDVFVVPGSIFSPLTYGNHRLIQDGAKLVMSYEDVVTEFSYLIKPARMSPKSEKIIGPDWELTESEQKIWDALGVASVSLDALVDKTELDIAQVLQSLTVFEVRGLVEQISGQGFRKQAY